MSTTTIYVLGAEPGEIGECRNAWRGAMYVWNDIAKRYFNLEGFPMGMSGPGGKANEIWNAASTHPLSKHEQIVLLSTMDNAIIWAKDIEEAAQAFDKYGEEHPNSSLAEQAKIMRSHFIRPDDAVAWLQTSVSEFWGHDWNDEREDYDWYEPASGTKHFDVMAEVRSRVLEEET
jgi:hypothetical protein